MFFYKVPTFSLHKERRLSRQRQTTSMHEHLEQTARQFESDQIQLYTSRKTNVVQSDTERQSCQKQQAARTLFMNPKQINQLLRKRLISTQEANTSVDRYNKREEFKKQLLNEPFMQIYLRHLKCNKQRLPMLLK